MMLHTELYKPFTIESYKGFIVSFKFFVQVFAYILFAFKFHGVGDVIRRLLRYEICIRPIDNTIHLQGA